MNYWQGDKIFLRAMEESDADFAMEQVSKGNDNSSPFLIIEDKDKNRVGMASPSIEDSRVGVFTSGIFIKPEFQRKGYAKEALFMIMKFYFN